VLFIIIYEQLVIVVVHSASSNCQSFEINKFDFLRKKWSLLIYQIKPKLTSLNLSEVLKLNEKSQFEDNVTPLPLLSPVGLNLTAAQITPSPAFLLFFSKI
jgi:hypothetical protein